MRDSVYIQQPTNWVGVAIKILAIVGLVGLTNFGFYDRVELLYMSQRWFTLVFYLGMWGASFLALFIAALQPNKYVRLAWAALLSVSATTAYMYTSVSGSDLSVFDALSLWTARHEAGRALEFYKSGIVAAVIVFITSFAIIALPPTPKHRWVAFSLKWLSWTPVVPVLLIAAIIFIKEGGGSQAMPSQFQPLAIGLVTAVKVAGHELPTRHPVAIKANKTRQMKNIVMLIDESVRPDYINWKVGNSITPNLALNADRIVNFGNAVSGGNCSSYSNALLRFGGTQKNLVKSMTTNPTIWQYAKAAGYRTVYIDGQSGLNKNPGLLQNFMTVGETKKIDRVVRFKNIPGPQLDFKLLEVIKKELAGAGPVFIYANKNGAHFPYDEGYPKAEIVFEPTVSQAQDDNIKTRVNSYYNVIRWSVDRFFKVFFQQIDLKKTTVVYTSDHGQAVYNGKLTHCSVNDPDPREGLVPMFVMTDDVGLKARLTQAAKVNFSKTSHFMIRPTVLMLMGYSPIKIAPIYGPSLLEVASKNPQFTSGDIFGMFRKEVLWTPLDLEKNYLEFKKPLVPSAEPTVGKLVRAMKE